MTHAMTTSFLVEIQEIMNSDLSFNRDSYKLVVEPSCLCFLNNTLSSVHAVYTVHSHVVHACTRTTSTTSAGVTE